LKNTDIYHAQKKGTVEVYGRGQMSGDLQTNCLYCITASPLFLHMVYICYVQNFSNWYFVSTVSYIY